MYEVGQGVYLNSHIEAGDGIEILAPKGSYVEIIEDEGCKCFIVQWCTRHHNRYLRVNSRQFSEVKV
jgi:hypothetical protein